MKRIDVIDNTGTELHVTPSLIVQLIRCEDWPECQALHGFSVELCWAWWRLSFTWLWS